ncbi:carboxymuconolactone decarboxylase family protein [Euzebya sp.]|uniref:carboxymuconolactone decarboxylase family protein n=1 Tax=Euzebya sp. TaxID=1971409 RepID=UPI0035184647
MPRIPPTPLTGLTGYLATRMSRRALGEVPDALGVMWHHRRVLVVLSAMGQEAERWDRVDPHLKVCAHMAVAALVGCAFCLDYGYYRAHDQGLDEETISQVPRWRESDVFSPLERDVMAYAEAMSQTPPQATDAQVDRLVAALGAPGVVELTAWIGYANLVTRSNVAMGIESQGLSTACRVPLAEPSSTAGAPT